MECMDCSQSDPCNGHGNCLNAVCQCDESRYGWRCEFEAPCIRLEMDIRYGGFVDERTWSTEFELFEVEGQLINAVSLRCGSI